MGGGNERRALPRCQSEEIKKNHSFEWKLNKIFVKHEVNAVIMLYALLAFTMTPCG